MMWARLPAVGKGPDIHSSSSISRQGPKTRREKVAYIEPRYDADVGASWRKTFCSLAANSHRENGF